MFGAERVGHEQLARWADSEGATNLQKSRLFDLWTGASEPSPELRTLLHEIAWPNEKARLLRFLGGRTTRPETDELLRSLAWK